MAVGWDDIHGYRLPLGRSVNRLGQQLADGWHPRGAVLRRSKEPARRKPGPDDRRLGLHEIGIKSSQLRAVKEVIRHGNVAGPVMVDPSSMSMPTLLNGRQPGREQPGTEKHGGLVLNSLSPKL